MFCDSTPNRQLGDNGNWTSDSFSHIFYFLSYPLVKTKTTATTKSFIYTIDHYLRFAQGFSENVFSYPRQVAHSLFPALCIKSKFAIDTLLIQFKQFCDATVAMTAKRDWLVLLCLTLEVWTQFSGCEPKLEGFTATAIWSGLK